MSCKICSGKGVIQQQAIGTRLYIWWIKCKACVGTGMTVQELADELDIADDYNPNGHWEAGCGPEHRVWRDNDVD